MKSHRRRLLPLACWFLFFATFAAEAQQQVQVTASKANIRLEPNASSAVVMSVPIGAVLPVVASHGEWHQVELPADASGFKRMGYIHASVVKALTVQPGPSDSGTASALKPPTSGSNNSATELPAPVEKPPAPPAAPVVTAGAEVPAMVASESGLYYVSEQGLVRIEAKTPYQTRTGSRLVSRLTFGIKPARINAMLMGLRSDLQVTSAPKFYMHLGQILGQSESIGEYYLVKFTVKERDGRREIEIGSANFAKFQAGFPEKDLFQIDTTRVDRDIYLISPKSALGGGEYGILQLPQGTSPAPLPRKIYDFGVR